MLSLPDSTCHIFALELKKEKKNENIICELVFKVYSNLVVLLIK